MKLNKEKAIELICRHKEATRILGLEKDVKLFEQIIEYINFEESTVTKTTKKPTPLQQFNEIVASGSNDLKKYGIKTKIIANKDSMIEYWNAIDEDVKEKYTIFDLNVIWYLISKHHTKYISKNKKDIIFNINSLVRDKNMKGSFDNIIV